MSLWTFKWSEKDTSDGTAIELQDADDVFLTVMMTDSTTTELSIAGEEPVKTDVHIPAAEVESLMRQLEKVQAGKWS